MYSEDPLVYIRFECVQIYNVQNKLKRKKPVEYLFVRKYLKNSIAIKELTKWGNNKLVCVSQ